jgi:hypothetical protein
MADSFDPYYRWLGIPPKEQPPNHYRLLGIELFESDPQLIDSFALRHTSFLRQITDGPHLRDAQRLLNELAAARRCLLTPAQKAAYDAELRAGLVEDKRLPAVETARAAQTPEPAAIAAVDAGRPTSTPDAVPVIAIAPRTESRTASVRVGAQRSSARGGSRRSPRAAPKSAGVALGTQVKQLIAAGTERLARPHGRRRKGLWAVGLALLAVVGLGAAALFRTPPPRRSEAVAAGSKSERASGLGVPIAERKPPLPKPAEGSTAELLGEPVMEAAPPAAASEPFGVAPVEPVAAHAKPERPAASEFVADGQPPRLAGLALWLDASQLTASGGRLTQWNDASGQGYSARPRQKSEQPEVLAQALGGKRVVRFRGGQRLEISRTSQSLNLRSDFTIVYVARGVAGTLLSKGSGAKAGQFSLYSNSCLLTNGELNANEGRFTAADDDPTEFRVRTIVADAAGLNWFLDGQAAGSYFDACYEIQNSSIVWIGSPWFRAGREELREYFMGDLAELVIYKRALPPAERESVEAYLREKWLSGDTPPPPLDLEPPPTLAAAVADPDQAEAQAEASPSELEQTPTLHPASEAPADGEAAAEAGASAEPTQHELLQLCVNLGGSAWQDPGGRTWVPSKKFDSATFGYEAGQAVKSDTVEHPVYNSAVRGLVGFRAVVPNGEYALELHFHEHWARDSTDRAFVAAVEQVPVLRPPLFFQGPGMGQPYVHKIGKVSVKDGRLDVDFAGVQPGSLAILNGIVIQQLR